MNRNIKWKEKKNRVGRETLKRCAELEFILICSNCFFQWLTYLTRTTGYYFRLINTTTFRKKTCLTQSIATSDRQVGLILYLSHHGETQQIETWKDMQPKFCIFYTWSPLFNRWSPWDFQANFKNANSANKDVFYIRQNYLNIVHWLMLGNFSLSGVFTKTIKLTLHIIV